MIGSLGSVFGIKVQAAESAEEWAALVEAARQAGGIEVGDATRNDYDIVFN